MNRNVIIRKILRESLSNILKVNDKNHKLNFSLNGENISYLDYAFDGSTFSEYISSNEKEFYISMIEILPTFRGQNLTKKILDYTKKYAKKLGPTVITLRVDYGNGSITTRNPNKGLEKLYLTNGFNYMFTEEECELNDVKNLGTMLFKL